MTRVGVVFAGLVCLASAGVRADPNSPVIDGDYQVGTFGVLRLTSTAAMNDRFVVKGTYVSGNKCGFAPSELLLEGTTDGSVLIAAFTTCIEGSGCQSPAKLPVMAVISEGSLTGYISLPRGCEAVGLEQRVTMQIAPSALRAAAKNFMEASPPNFERAASVLRRLSDLPEGRNDLEVLLQLGSALNGSKHYAEGRKVFERALVLPSFQSANAETRTMILYNLACSESGLSEKEPGLATQALEHLKLAVNTARGTRIILKDYAAEDGDLAPIRANPEFQKLFGLKKGPR